MTGHLKVIRAGVSAEEVPLNALGFRDRISYGRLRSRPCGSLAQKKVRLDIRRNRLTMPFVVGDKVKMSEDFKRSLQIVCTGHLRYSAICGICVVLNGRRTRRVELETS